MNHEQCIIISVGCSAFSFMMGLLFGHGKTQITEEQRQHEKRLEDEEPY